VLVFLEQDWQVLAHVARPIQNPVQKPGTLPEGLPTQSPVALVVEARGFKLGSLDLDLRVVEKDFHFFFTRLMIRANIHRQPAPAMLQNPA
jgi:hypothetical protein